MQGSLGAGVLPYNESGNRRRVLVGGEGTWGCSWACQVPPCLSQHRFFCWKRCTRVRTSFGRENNNTAFLQSANDTFPFEHLRISKSLKSIVCQTILINFVCNILDWLSANPYHTVHREQTSQVKGISQKVLESIE